MGHREQLLTGAKRCLLERGYARTTARDIVAASGTNLASIGYHFGSKDALLNAAMLDAIAEWGEELGRVLGAESQAGTEGDPADRLERLWDRMIESFGNHRALWLASFEAFVVSAHSPDLRRQLADGQDLGRSGLAAQILDIAEEAVSAAVARSVGSVGLAMVSGLLAQHLVDPDRAPTGKEVADGLRALAASGRASEPAAG